MLAQLGLAEHSRKFPATLSGGERQRLAIARAVINDPAVLLADEPTGALDRRNGEAALAILEDLNRRGQTILLVTHDEHLATQTAHRTIQLDRRHDRRRRPTADGGVMGAVRLKTLADLRRRRLQSFGIALVLLLSTAAGTLALSILVESHAPFEHAFEAANGAHLVIRYRAISRRPSWPRPPPRLP